jgi:hypothetical protein
MQALYFFHLRRRMAAGFNEGWSWVRRRFSRRPTKAQLRALDRRLNDPPHVRRKAVPKAMKAPPPSPAAPEAPRTPAPSLKAGAEIIARSSRPTAAPAPEPPCVPVGGWNLRSAPKRAKKPTFSHIKSRTSPRASEMAQESDRQVSATTPATLPANPIPAAWEVPQRRYSELPRPPQPGEG